MVLAQRHPPELGPPTRASWLAWLGVGLGLPVVSLVYIILGLGYEFLLDGKTPHLLILAGLAMLSAPSLARSREKYVLLQEHRRQQVLLPDESGLMRARVAELEAENHRLRRLTSSPSGRFATLELPAGEDEDVDRR